MSSKTDYVLLTSSSQTYFDQKNTLPSNISNVNQIDRIANTPIEKFEGSKSPWKRKNENSILKLSQIISQDLSFSKEVISEKCPGSIPYNEIQYSQYVYDETDFETSKKVFDWAKSNQKSKSVREPLRVYSRLPLSNAQKLKSESNQKFKNAFAPPLPKVKPLTKGQKHYVDKTCYGKNSDDENEPAGNGDEMSTKNEISDSTNSEQRECWDEYVLSLMSINMARYLSSESNISDLDKLRLKQRVIDWYGDFPDLVEFVPTEDSRKASKESPTQADLVERRARLENWPPSLFVYMENIRFKRQLVRKRKIKLKEERRQKQLLSKKLTDNRNSLQRFDGVTSSSSFAEDNSTNTGDDDDDISSISSKDDEYDIAHPVNISNSRAALNSADSWSHSLKLKKILDSKEYVGILKNSVKKELESPMDPVIYAQLPFTPGNSDPYADETQATFYRRPMNIRKSIKEDQKSINQLNCNQTTATIPDYNINEVIKRNSKQRKYDTVKMADKFPSTYYITNNEFEKDLLSGGKQQKIIGFDMATNEMLCTEPNNRYVKQINPIVPPVHFTDDHHINSELFATLPNTMSNDFSSTTVHKQQRGTQRWNKLPKLFNSQIMKDLKKRRISVGAIEEQNRLNMNSRDNARKNVSLNRIVEEWRKKWHLNQKFSDSTVKDLLKDMADIHPTIRLNAIVTFAKAATFKMDQTNSIFHVDNNSDHKNRNQEKKYGQNEVISYENSEDTEFKTTNFGDWYWSNHELPTRMFKALEHLLSDSHSQVRKAAAIAMFTLERPNKMAEQILRSLLIHGTRMDRWTAAQCLAHFKATDGQTISELVDQMMNSEDNILHEQACFLLAKISEYTNLVHGIIGERLNSASWRQRLIACKVIPLLHGHLNKDLLNKLSYLLWNDPHSEVRIGAGQALGRTGHGKQVHDQIKLRLESPDQMARIDALNKLGFLGLMTSQLLPSFLECFSDSFVNVRIEVCRTSHRLYLTTPRCLRKLIELIEEDPINKVKIYALKALSVLSKSSPTQLILNEDPVLLSQIRVDIKNCLIWTMQFEKDARVRLTALQMILKLKIQNDSQTIQILKQRFMFEEDEYVRSSIKTAIVAAGVDLTADLDTVAEVKQAVRRCFAEDGVKIVTDKILFLEESKNVEQKRRELIVKKDSTYFTNHQKNSINQEESTESLQINEKIDGVNDQHEEFNQTSSDILANQAKMNQKIKLNHEQTNTTDLIQNQDNQENVDAEEEEVEDNKSLKRPLTSHSSLLSSKFFEEITEIKYAEQELYEEQTQNNAEKEEVDEIDKKSEKYRIYNNNQEYKEKKDDEDENREHLKLLEPPEIIQGKSESEFQQTIIALEEERTVESSVSKQYNENVTPEAQLPSIEKLEPEICDSFENEKSGAESKMPDSDIMDVSNGQLLLDAMATGIETEPSLMLESKKPVSTVIMEDNLDSELLLEMEQELSLNDGLDFQI